MTGSGRRRDDAENYEGVADNVNYSAGIRETLQGVDPPV